MIFEYEINANKNCYIVKIRTTEGYKVGLSRDFGTGISMEEQEYVELLEDKNIQMKKRRKELSTGARS